MNPPRPVTCARCRGEIGIQGVTRVETTEPYGEGEVFSELFFCGEECERKTPKLERAE